MGFDAKEDKKSLDVVQDFEEIIHALEYAVVAPNIPPKDKKTLERLLGQYRQALRLELKTRMKMIHEGKD
ncbi:MAG: hypothetical protein DRO96_01460 [Candidatus Aenigmatarchaeota archaeon]|nr:MAG: hypothetical protein DRO96_01460 [Candidatus Aenigmarchaeota archaeon]